MRQIQHLGRVTVRNLRALRRLKLRSMAAGRRLVLSHEGALLLESFSGMRANAAVEKMYTSPAIKH